MKTFTFKSSLFTAGLLSLVALLLNCKGDAGAVGPSGAGFDEATKDGKIVVYLDGTRPDGKAFKDTLEFKFAATYANYNSSAYTNGWGANYNIETYVKRYLAMDNNSNNNTNGDSYVSIDFEASLSGADTVKNFDMYLNTDVTSESDHKYFRMNNDEFYFQTNSSDNGVTNYAVTAYKYDTTSGKVSYKFKFTQPYGYDACNDGCYYYNSTGYDLNVSGYVDAIVYQNIGNCNCGRKRSNSRASKTVTTKAEMKDLPIKAN